VSDITENDSIQETLENTMKAIRMRDDVAECNQSRNVNLSIYLKLIEEERTLKKAKQTADKKSDSIAYHIAQSKLDLVNELLSIDGLEEVVEKQMGTASEKKPRNNQIAKKVCQGIAQTLWKADPDMTIAAMLDREEIREYGGAKFYEDKTIRSWLSAVDPRPPEKKSGRPKSK